MLHPDIESATGEKVRSGSTSLMLQVLARVRACACALRVLMQATVCCYALSATNMGVYAY